MALSSSLEKKKDLSGMISLSMKVFIFPIKLGDWEEENEYKKGQGWKERASGPSPARTTQDNEVRLVKRPGLPVAELCLPSAFVVTFGYD